MDSSSTRDFAPIAPSPRYEFEHHRLDAWKVALEALVLGDTIARGIPRGYGSLKDQLTRALLGAFLQTTEGAARTGADRLCRLRVARAEASEAAAATEAVGRLGLCTPQWVDQLLGLLWRLCAMLTKLSRLGR
jgi:four helix bundle protein